MDYSILPNSIRALLDLIPANVYWKDRQGVCLGCNQTQAKVLGFKSSEEMVGKSAYDLGISAKEQEHIFYNDERVMSSGESLRLEEMTTINGDAVIYISHKIPLFDDQGQVVGLFGISFDVTQQKQSELQAIAQSKQTQLTLEQIVARMPGHVYWVGYDGYYLGCNQAQAEVFGFQSPKEFIGKTLFDLMDKKSAYKIRQLDLQVMNSGQERMVEEIIPPQGVLLSKKIPMRDEKNDVIGMVGISFDITEQKKAQQLEKEKAILEEKAKLSKMLSASIAHELRTPLSTIDLLSNSIKMSWTKLVDNYQSSPNSKAFSPEKLQLLQAIPDELSRVIKKANTFINMMLFKADLDNSQVKQLVTVSINTCIDEALADYPFEADEMSLIHVNADDNFKAKLDTELFKYVIFNLLKNALYAIKRPTRGHIEICLELGDNNNYLHFKDTGAGIEAEKIDKIFQLFYSKTRHGSGVGLAFCKHVMQEIGGDITCQSELGHFTQFTLSFPVISL